MIVNDMAEVRVRGGWFVLRKIVALYPHSLTEDAAMVDSYKQTTKADRGRPQVREWRSLR